MSGRQRKYDKACVMLETTLQIRINILGLEDAAVGQALFSLGILFNKTKEYDAALKSFTDCLNIQRMCYGFESLEYARTLNAIAGCLGNQGDFDGALNVWLDVLAIYHQLKYDSNHPDVIALERNRDLATRLLAKTKTRWDIFRS